MGLSAVAERSHIGDDTEMEPSVTESTQVLSEADCLALLQVTEVGRLAIAINNVPDIFPLNFVVDHGTIVFRSAEGTKLAGAVLGKSVAFEVDGWNDTTGVAWSVIVKGHAVEIESMNELFEAIDLPLYPWHSAPKHRFVRIRPSQITGRQFRLAYSPTGNKPKTSPAVPSATSNGRSARSAAPSL